MRMALLAAAVAAPLCGPALAAPATYAGDKMGTMGLWSPAGTPDGIVFLFSDSGGWTPALDDAAARIAGLGPLVLGVDSGAYLQALDAAGGDCHYMIAEVEGLAQEIERERAVPTYHAPILTGTGIGATLAYVGLAQAPTATVAGAASLDMAPSLRTTIPFCPGAPATRTAEGFAYAPHTPLPGWWRVGAEAPDPALTAAVAASEGDFVLLKPGTGVGDRLATLLRPDLSQEAAADADILADLPLEELPASHPNGRLAVVYSGDGGWRDLDKTIAEQLQASGVSVVGVDSLRYFWRAKTPERIAADLRTVIDHYSRVWTARYAILIGYSFGANILPFAYNAMAPEDKARISQITLLGLATHADFSIRVTGWLGLDPSDGGPSVLPELARMDRAKVQCVYGSEEEDTACTDPALQGAEIVRTAGGHHFDGDYGRLARLILAGAAKRQQ
jgi:type IV secretory pathway VirJ component